MTKITASKTVEINAPAAKVWDALTNPEMIKKYFFGTEAKSDWKAGSDITFSGEWEGKPYQDKGKILAIDPGKSITYTYYSSMSGKEDLPENYNNVTYSLQEADGKTKVTITQDGIADEKSKEHSENNWGMVLDGMKKLLE